jgi:hypothetical protein
MLILQEFVSLGHARVVQASSSPPGNDELFVTNGDVITVLGNEGHACFAECKGKAGWLPSDTAIELIEVLKTVTYH